MEQNNTPTPNNVAPEAMGKRSWLDRKFKLKEHGTSVKIEIMAGITTFMAMVYILMVNAGMFSDLQGTVFNGPSYGAMYITTAISAIIGTVLIGLLSGLPLAQAPGMGLNAFFVYTICMGFGLTYANALVLVLIDGIVFIILTVTGLRKAIFTAIPDCVKKAIPAGIGLFIAFIGLQNAGIVVANSSTLVNLVSLNLLGSARGQALCPYSSPSRALSPLPFCQKRTSRAQSFGEFSARRRSISCSVSLFPISTTESAIRKPTRGTLLPTVGL